jgi:hypothetical protein
MPFKFRPHTYIRTTFIGLVAAIILFLFTGILFQKHCSSEPEVSSCNASVSAPASVSSGACIDVHASVFGNIIPGSRVNLFQVSNTEFSVVMEEIRTREPIDWDAVGANKRFGFECLSLGSYAFVIPTSSYNRSVGAPLPDEPECGSPFVEIAFHGGDWQYAVGAFSINESCRQA